LIEPMFHISYFLLYLSHVKEIVWFNWPDQLNH